MIDGKGIEEIGLSEISNSLHKCSEEFKELFNELDKITEDFKSNIRGDLISSLINKYESISQNYSIIYDNTLSYIDDVKILNQNYINEDEERTASIKKEFNM